MTKKRKSLFSLIGLAVVISAFVFTFFPPLQAQGLELKDMSILTSEGILIKGYFDLTGGNVCSRNGDIRLGGSGNVRMDLVPALISTASPAGAIFLENFAKVKTVATNNLQVIGTSGVSTPSSVLPPEECPVDPQKPSFDVSFDAADDVVCTQAGTDIFPGKYRDLKVDFRGKCNFQGPGEYNFRSINADTNSTYEFNFLSGQCNADNGFNINVLEFAFFGEYGFFNKANTPSVFLYVAGIDSDWPERTYRVTSFISPFTSTYPAFGYKGDGEFNACYVFAPNGTVALKGKSDKPFNAVWIGKYFWEWNTLRVQTQPPGNFETCCQPVYYCSCLFDLFPTEVCPGDTITIIGAGLNSNTVDAVYFFPVAGTINLADPEGSATCSQSAVTFVDDSTMKIQVPAGCGPGDYYLGTIDNSLKVNLVSVLTIKSSCP